MSKSSGGTRNSTGGSDFERLMASDNWFIRAGMNSYISEKNSGEWDYSDMKNLSDEEKAYVVAYLSNAYRVVNESERGVSENADAKILSKKLSRAVEKLNNFDGTSYRVESFNKRSNEYENRLSFFKENVGKEITQSGYFYWY